MQKARKSGLPDGKAEQVNFLWIILSTGEGTKYNDYLKNSSYFSLLSFHAGMSSCETSGQKSPKFPGPHQHWNLGMNLPATQLMSFPHPLHRFLHSSHDFNRIANPATNSVIPCITLDNTSIPRNNGPHVNLQAFEIKRQMRGTQVCGYSTSRLKRTGARSPILGTVTTSRPLLKVAETPSPSTPAGKEKRLAKVPWARSMR